MFKTIQKAFFAFFFIQNICFGAIESSIVPVVDKFECVDNLPIKKYSPPQAQEILDALSCKSEKLRVVTYNMLAYDSDNKLESQNRWSSRLPRIVELLEEMKPDIIGSQELYESQVRDIMPHLGSKYAFYSKNQTDGEINGIFYRKDRFRFLCGRVWFMTPTPEIPSHYTLTMVKLKDLKTGKELAVFNTHLSFSKVEKRGFQAEFIAQCIEPYAKSMPVIFMGDCNTFPNRPDLKDLPAFDGDYVERVLTRGSLRDAKSVSLIGHLGPISTFTNLPGNGIPFKGDGTPGIFLDHLFVSKGVVVLVEATQSGKVNGNYPSDHMPVFIDCLLR